MRTTSLALVFGGILFLPFATFGQSNDVIDRLLAAETAGLQDALYMIGVVSSADPEASLAEGLAAVEWKEYGIDPARRRRTITFGELSYLLVEELGLAQGVMYSLFPGPRYAVRELRYADLPARRYYPNTELSGLEALRLIQRAADRAGGQ